ncbi:MAG: SPOR domain-containing protein [Pseudomonadota bacterium]
MPLNNSGMVALALLLAGCGGGSGPRDAPFIATPPLDGGQTDPGPMAPQYDPPRTVVPASTLDQSTPPDMPRSSGPRGTSGEQRYDAVGYAGSFDGRGFGAFSSATITVGHASLPIGSYVELTALDTGRTIVAVVAAQAGDGVVALSPGAAQLLGAGEGGAVRVRLITPSMQDQMALRSGRSAAPRIDAPATLLTALRRKLPGRAVATPPVRPTARPPRAIAAPPGARYAPPTTTAPEQSPVRSGYVVQVAAFSTRERAQVAARAVGGKIVAAGGIFRVQIGPFPDTAGAQRARDEVARRGYADARILHIE